MKSLKLSFAGIIAVFAIGLTITANAGIFKNTVLAPESFCYTSVSSKLTCPAVTEALSSLGCTDAQAFASRPVYGISSVNRIDINNLETACPGGNAFCCAEIEAIPTALCSGQPLFNIDATGNKLYKIAAVHCKQ